MNFHRHFIFYLFYCTLFLCYWCFSGLGLRVCLAYRVTQAGNIIQNTKRKKIFTCNFFQCPELHNAETQRTTKANLTAVHCACLKALSTQAPHSVLTWLSTTTPFLKTGVSWSMGLPVVTQVVWGTFKNARKYHMPSVLAFISIVCSLLYTIN